MSSPTVPTRVTGRLVGVWTVAGLDLRTRLRGRWRWVLATWTVLLLVLTGLVRWAVSQSGQIYDPGLNKLVPDTRPLGPPVFGSLLMIILSLGLLVVPSFTASGINGERERGTLAVLQATLLRPWEITVGKLVAGIESTGVLLIAAIPALAWSWALGGMTALEIVRTMLGVLLVFAVVVSVSLACSGLLARPIASAMVSYLVVAGLCLGTVVIFAIGVSATADSKTVYQKQDIWVDAQGNEQLFPTDQNNPNQPPTKTVTSSFQLRDNRPDKVWWLLAPNPLVIVADLAPFRVPLIINGQPYRDDRDPLVLLQDNIMDLRSPPAPLDENGNPIQTTHSERGPLLWPGGITIVSVFGLAGCVLSARRLRTPYGRLPRGVRVA